MTKSFFLVVFFLVNGEPTILDGWYPRPAPDMETCAARAERTRDYLDLLEDKGGGPGYPAEVRCAMYNTRSWEV